MADDELENSLGTLLQIAEDEDKIIIGVDFGTTYSGIAYVFSGDQEKAGPISVQDWPGARGKKWPKVPTTIRYDDQDKSTFKWGYELDQFGVDKIEGIKLLLDPDQPRPLYLSVTDIQAELDRLPKPPVDIAADYIGAMYKHALSVIGDKWPAEFLSMLQKKFVLSVPAVWSDKAKNCTLQAARKAGIHNVELVKEPEAAALYTLYELKNKALKVGDAFVLCDAGGGTVDLISYEITKLDPLELKELVPGTGGLAGSLMLNKRFEEVIEAAVGKEQFIALRKTEGFRTAMRQFDESIKPGFNPFEDPKGERKNFINFPKAGLKDDSRNLIQRDLFTLTHATLVKIFKPLVDAILGLVKDQVSCVKIKRMEDRHPKAAEIKAIFLVGGFGSSIYLKECLQKAHPQIQVIQPHEAWPAIVKGAVLSQLKGPLTATVISTMATRHYGVSATSPWEPADEGQPKIWDPFKEIDRVEKMTWYIYQGDDLQRDQEIRFSFLRRIRKDYSEDDLVFKDDLIQSEEINPPKYPGEYTKTNCTLVADFRKVPKTQFKFYSSKSGKEFYEIHYDLVINLKTALMQFSAEIDGKSLGAVRAKYE